MGRKIIMLLVFLTLACIPLTGCQLKDIDKRFFVVTVGFDSSDDPANPYRLTLRLALPSSKVEEGGAMSIVQTIDAPSIAEAVRHLKSNVDKELEFGHCREFIFGKELLDKQGFAEEMYWLARRRDIQSSSNLMVGIPDAESVVRLKPKSERYPGNSLFLAFGNEGTEASYIVTTYLFDMYRREYETGLDPVMPIVYVRNDTYQIDRAALFDKNKIRLVLNADETQIFNMTANDVSKSVMALPHAQTRLVLAVTKTRTRISISSGKNPVVTLYVRAAGFLEQSPIELVEKDFKGIEKQIGDHFSGLTEDLLYKIRDHGVDPYGFGLHYLANHYGQKSAWEAWKKLYPQVRFQVKTTVTIQSTGLIR